MARPIRPHLAPNPRSDSRQPAVCRLAFGASKQDTALPDLLINSFPAGAASLDCPHDFLLWRRGWKGQWGWGWGGGGGGGGGEWLTGGVDGGETGVNRTSSE